MKKVAKVLGGKPKKKVIVKKVAEKPKEIEETKYIEEVVDAGWPPPQPTI